MRPTLQLSLAILAAPVVVTVALLLAADPQSIAASAPLVHRNGGYLGAASCKSCHPDQHASWRQTFHATMTQLPDPVSVRGAFDGREVRYAGEVARPFRDGDRFCMDLPVPGAEAGARRRAEVALVVGSRRYQQYFETERRGDSVAYVRLPILWHIEQQRWLHLNTVFLGPDDANWQAHAATWNENCIFCHNTGPEPRARNTIGRSSDRPSFDSEVAELGIACESCHGPGAAHAAEQRNPLRRYGAPFVAAGENSAVHPDRLAQDRSVAVCGQCHGARLPNPLSRMHDWFETGPTYRPGEDLLAHVTPIERDTKVVAGDPEMYSLRFWGDGTPRLTAYELQGVLASACYRDGEMTCNSCHSMHSGDPRGQLRPDRPGNALCLQCHGDIARDLSAHTRHAVDSAGSSCVECHMPKIVYGVLDIHRSHRIENPDPARDARAGRPNACTLCHTDQTLTWAAATLRDWFGPHYEPPVARRDGADLALPDALASLHAGDAAVRAVYAAALGREVAAVPASATTAQRSHLAVAMGDGYPSVRWLAQRSLLQLEQRAPFGLQKLLQAIDSTDGPEARHRAVFATLDAVTKHAQQQGAAPNSTALLGRDLRLDLAAVIRLTDLQGRNVIAIGE